MQFYVRDIMTPDVISIQEDKTIRDLVKLFADKNLYGVPVINEEGYITGVVTSTDILKNESSHTFYHEPFMQNFEPNLFEDAKFFDQPVTTIMSRDLYTIGPDEPVTRMARTMYNKRVHRLLVTEYNKLIGVVSTFDLLKLLASSDEKVIV